MIVTTYTVFCSNCSNWFPDESGETKREARSLAKAKGWRRVKVQNGSLWDLCPKCYELSKSGKLR